ncbi:MAG: VOC family protein [Methanomassiliicoccales archaeon]|nr:MAG: VOC family protein [Methanomassiliicoccales archaeon]
MIKRIWDISLTVSNLKKAVDFYENVLGLQKKYEFEDYAGFDCGGVELGLKTWGDMENPRKGEPVIDFLVEDIDETYRTLREKKVKFTREPKDTLWGGRTASFLDPDANNLQLVQIDWGKYFTSCNSQ